MPQEANGEPLSTLDDPRNPIAFHQRLEIAQRSDVLLVRASLALYDVVRISVAEGQRIAALAIAQKKPAFIIDRPYLVRLLGHGELLSLASIDSRRLAAPGLD